MSTQPPSWDLTAYYNSLNDPQIELDLKVGKERSEEFATNFRTKVSNLSPDELLKAIKTDEELTLLLNKPAHYLHLLYEAGGSDIELIQQKMISINETTTHIANLTTFFGVELSKRPDLTNLSGNPILSEYSYYLKRLSQNAKYVLSEEVENVLSLKDLAGSEAWGKFFGDLSSKIEVEADIEGEVKKYRESDLMVLLKDHRPEIRQKAWSVMIGETSKLESNALEAINNLILDHKIEDNLRGFSTPHESSLIGNQITQAVLDSLRTAIKSKIPVLQSFTKLKSEILGIEKLEIYDVYAEIAFEGLELPKYDWDTAKNIILEAFGQFNPKFKEIAELFFENNWIDAADRPQKRGGAFCSGFGLGFHPVILCTYKERFEDVLTVAHELGHGIHSYLTEKAQSLINSNYTMSTAEIASLCCETIVFDKLIETITDPRLKLQLYCNKIEDESANIFMAGLSYFEFELALHTLYRENGPISKEQIRELWLTNRYENIFGDLVNKTKGAEFSWLRVHHWVYVFYNYVYASGLLISSSIYNVLKADPSKIKDYLEVLELGGSKSPVELLKRLGLNIEDPTFWDMGLSLYAAQVEQAQSLWSEVKHLKKS